MPIYEILIQNHDNTSPVLVTDRRCYKKGDVICVMPAGHNWTDAERKNVVKANLTEKEKSDLMLRDQFAIGDPEIGYNNILKIRQYKLNIPVDNTKIKTVLNTDFVKKI